MKFLVLLIFRSISKITVAINNAILDNEAPTMFIILNILNNKLCPDDQFELRMGTWTIGLRSKVAGR